MNIGIDIGGSHIGIGLINEKNQIIAKKEHNWTDREKLNITETIEYYCKKLISEIIKENNNPDIKKIGIGYPSKNIIDGVIYINNEPFYISDILNKEFRVPVYLKNDVKCSALCEKTVGNLKEYDNCLFMTLGTGIGGAYFYKNELVTPNKYQGFEIGHMIIEVNGKKCKCGISGCFEQYASMRVFRKKIEELFNIETLTSYKMFEILQSKQKEKEVSEIIDEYIEYLSVGISNLINIFEPDAICIGGSFAYYAPIFMKSLKEKTQKKFKNREIPDLLTAEHANDAGIIGAAMLQEN